MERAGQPSAPHDGAGIAIAPAVTADDFAAFGHLIRDYVDWLRVRIAGDAWFMDRVLAHQSLDRELTALASKYGPPNGRTFLARRGGEICGGGAYQRFDECSCEMKRLFVPPRFQGQGIGRKLSETLIAAAPADGYALMRLDTARHLREAIAMYETLRFRRCPPYQPYPDELMPYLVFMERPLAER